MPSLYHFGAAVSRGDFQPEQWSLLSLDIAGAHKTIRTAPEDVGFSAFMFGSRAFVYLVNHFGAAWSAYWWGRLSALLVRAAHFLLRHKHIGGAYIDDFLFLFPRASALQLGAVLIAFLQVLNVPLSWKKLRLGQELEYLGWKLSLANGFWATMTESKLRRLFAPMRWWFANPKQIQREELQQFLGLAIWATQVHVLLRPFLAPLFRALYCRSAKLQCLSLPQIEELLRLVSDQLEVVEQPALSDVQRGWQIKEVGKQACADAAALRAFLSQPKLTNGRAWVRFSAWAPTTTFQDLQKAALRQLLLYFENPSFELQQPQASFHGAADVWAEDGLAGLGGWFINADGAVRWFHVEIRLRDIPPNWDWPETMQKGIGALEILAQQVLVQLRGPVGASVRVHIRQYCENMGVVGCVAKGLCVKFPMGAALISLAKACLSHQCALEVSHVAGVRSDDADALSRLNHPGGPPVCQERYPPSCRIPVDVKQIWQPWQEFMLLANEPL